MDEQLTTTLAGSFLPAPAGKTQGVPDKSETIEVTVRLRRKKKLPPRAMTGKILSLQSYERSYAASRDDSDKVEAFAHLHNLSTVTVNLARRSIILRGAISDFELAFHTSVITNDSYRVLTGAIKLPADLSAIIVGVFGLDNRPVARPMFQVLKQNGQIVSHVQSGQTYTANQLAGIYGFPASATGAGQCIGIIELGGGFRQTDITAYFNNLGIVPPVVKAISVDGGTNSPSTSDGADGEVMLDIEVAGAVAPGAAIAVYFAPNTDQGFLDAITSAVHDEINQPSVISISWGSAELNWTTQALDNFNEAIQTAAALGVNVCVASGDSGSRDGETDGKVHVDFPASSPYALACGGTTLRVQNNQIVSETVWHDSADSASGGGVSTHFPLPDYQASAKVPLEIDTKFKGRGVPDVAGNADPNSGYSVLVDGQQLIIGGTSAVAPLMAGLIALLNEGNKKRVGFIHPQIYADPSLCRDITVGNNKTTSKDTGYSAGAGWDACSGLGVMSHL